MKSIMWQTSLGEIARPQIENNIFVQAVQLMDIHKPQTALRLHMPASEGQVFRAVLPAYRNIGGADCAVRSCRPEAASLNP